MDKLNGGRSEWWRGECPPDVEQIAVPLNVQFAPYIAKAVVDQDKLSSDELKLFIKNIVEEKSIQVHFLCNLLKEIGINIFIGYHVSTPEQLDISIDYSEDIKEFVKKRNIELPHLPI